MLPGNPGTDFLVRQQVSQYRNALLHWVQQVRSSRTPIDAFRRAAQPPAPGHMIRSLSALYSSDKSRATSQIESHLMDVARKSSLQPQELDLLMRLSQGYFPKVWRALEETRRKAK